MAENAVHISTVEHAKPTIFELWAQESFMRTLQPAFNIICNSCQTSLNVNKFPFSLLGKWRDETFLVLNSLLQYQYLEKQNASFSESFYGLKRVCINSTSGGLSTKHRIISLLCLTGLPYVATKLQAYIDSASYDLSSESEESKSKLVFTVARTAFSVWELIKLCNYISYMSGYSRTHSILHKLAQVELIYQNEQVPTWTQIYELFNLNSNKGSLIFPIIFRLITQFIEMSAFFIMLLNWWVTDDSRMKTNNFPIPDPPSSSYCKNKNVCPLCFKKWRVEVVLSTSGIVYCYSCIKAELDKTGVCPISKIPSSSDNLIRLYLNDGRT